MRSVASSARRARMRCAHLTPDIPFGLLDTRCCRRHSVVVHAPRRRGRGTPSRPPTSPDGPWWRATARIPGSSPSPAPIAHDLPLPGPTLRSGTRLVAPRIQRCRSCCARNSTKGCRRIRDRLGAAHRPRRAVWTRPSSSRCAWRTGLGRTSRRGTCTSSPWNSAASTRCGSILLPPQPEHAGIGVYETVALSARILIVGATDEAFDRWWAGFDQTKDCEADRQSRQPEVKSEELTAVGTDSGGSESGGRLNSGPPSRRTRDVLQPGIR